MSLASIGTIASSLFILGVSYCIVANIDYMLQNIDDTMGVTAFVVNDITDMEIEQTQRKIESRPEVKDVEYVSPEEAWERFKASLGDEEEVLEGLDEDNPLRDSASFEIHVHDITEQDSLVEYLKSMPQIRNVKYIRETAEILIGLGNLIRYVSIALIVILLFIGILLITNTIKLTVYMRKNEISIMKYIGATDGFIRWPFIFEGMVIGIIGAAIPFGVIYLAYDYIVSLIYTEFNVIRNIMTFLPTQSIINVILPTYFIIGVTMGVIGSNISLRKHLKV